MFKQRIAVIFILIVIVILSGCSTKTTVLNNKTEQKKETTQNNNPAGCKCHSKNPKLVKMHSLFSPVDCGNCHKENPMSKKSNKEEMKSKKYKNKLCTKCHKSPKKILSNSSRVKCIVLYLKNIIQKEQKFALYINTL